MPRNSRPSLRRAQRLADAGLHHEALVESLAVAAEALDAIGRGLNPPTTPLAANVVQQKNLDVVQEN